MALREDRIGQTWLVPKHLTDFIQENHIAYFIANLVEELDFKDIDRKYMYTRGKAAYSRRMLLRLVIMAFSGMEYFHLDKLRSMQKKIWFICISQAWISLIFARFAGLKSNAQNRLKKHLK